MDALITIFLIALSVALDAFAVSVAGGIKSHRHSLWEDALKVGAYFGIFQAGMPVIGSFMGSNLREIVVDASGWIAFGLLLLVGIEMIADALEKDQHVKKTKSLLKTRTLLMMSVATSIDALMVGVSLSLVELPLAVSVFTIGIVTFLLSVFGFRFGKKLGSFFAGKVEIVGGIGLICIGLKLLVA